MRVGSRPSQSDGRPGVRAHLLAGQHPDMSLRKQSIKLWTGARCFGASGEGGHGKGMGRKNLCLYCLTF